MNSSIRAYSSTFLFVLSLVHGITLNAAESVPPLVNYQGFLTDANGGPMAGIKSMEFNLYDAPTGGNRKWGPQIYATVPLIGGKFNVLLGPTDSGGQLITTAFADKTRYLSITIEGKEILPRQQILSAPFAIKADNGVPVGTVISYGGGKIPEGWLPCDGSVIPADVVFKELRDTVGNTTPDLRSRFILGAGQGVNLSSYAMHAKAGEESHVLTLEEMPPHAHSIQLGNNTGAGPDDWVQHSDHNGGNWGVTWTGSAGSGWPHNNMPPYYVLRYLIKY